MEKQKPFVHFFKTKGCNYIYDVNRNTILKVTPETYELLYDLCNAESSNAAGIDIIENDYIQKLCEKGFLSSNRIERIVHPETEALEHQLEYKLQRMILQVTQQCNFRCEYCVYSGNYENRTHANTRMSLETAKEAIDFFISHSSESYGLSIAFYGGEPLLEFELVKQAMEYAKGRIGTKPLTFSLTTNGTLLNDEIVSYFEENNVILFVSLDGPKEIHDKNRKFINRECSTFDKVMNNLKDIAARYPEYYKKMAFSIVIDPKNDLKCTSNFFHENELVKELYKAPSLIDMSYRKSGTDVDDRFYEDLEYELFKLFLNKLGLMDAKYVSGLIAERYFNLKRLDKELEPSDLLKKEWHHSGPCLPGVQRLMVDVNGDFFPCERVSESSSVMKIGSLKEGFDYEKVKTLLNIGRLSEQNCKECWGIRYCTICAKLCDNGRELSAATKEINCGMVKKALEERLKDYCTLKEFGHDFEAGDELLEDFF